MKIAYFCYLTQLDTDLSFIQEAQKIGDVTTYIYVNPKHFDKSIIKLNKLYAGCGVFESSIYPELSLLRPLIDLKKIRIINIPKSRYWELSAFKIFNSLFKKVDNEFDIVHLTSILQPPEFPLYKLRKKIVMTVHDPLPHSHSSRLYKLARNYAMRKISNFIIFNKTQAATFEETYKLQDKRILVSQFGIFPWLRLIDSISIKQQEAEKTPYILFAGRISQYKGIDYLLPAMKKVHEKHPNLKLIIAGSGKFHFDISKWEDLPYMEFRNRFIPDAELIGLIKNSLFLVCPYTDATQSGVVMSAFTFNKPVLATNVGGLPEMICPNRHGLIVEEKNIDALTDGICCMLDNPITLTNFSSNIATDYSTGERSWRNITAEIFDFYKTIVSGY